MYIIHSIIAVWFIWDFYNKYNLVLRHFDLVDDTQTTNYGHIRGYYYLNSLFLIPIFFFLWYGCIFLLIHIFMDNLLLLLFFILMLGLRDWTRGKY